MDIYIYYTIRESAAPLAQARVEAMHRHIGEAYEINVSLKRRLHDADGLQTWMEIYLDVPSGFDQLIEQAAAEQGVSELAQAGRHVEYFEDVPACA